MASLLVCASSNVLLPGRDEPTPATIIVDKASGTIVEVRETLLSRDGGDFIGQSVEWIDAGDHIVLPGLVDAHVHLNEPGRTAWEGFWTGTRAAASGGITTLVDMPLNSLPPTTTVENLETKREAAQAQCHTDVAFWGGVIPDNEEHLKPLVHAGVRGFKCFLMESGVEEFPCVSEQDLMKSMRELEESGSVLLFHAELEDSKLDMKDANPTHYSTFLASRPPQLETNAIALVIKLQRQFPKLRCHIVHLSAAAALPMIKEARASGALLTVETCFHYLCLSAEDIPDGHAEFKCCPPVRGSSNRDRLWEALREGVIDCVVSDHSPCILELKRLDDGDVMAAWGGISTLGLGLSLLWTEGQKRGMSLRAIVDTLTRKTAEHAGLGERKGQIKAGYDADFVIWNSDVEQKVTKEQLHYKNKVSPYDGLILRGRVEETYLRGHKVFSYSTGFNSTPPVGKLI